MRVLKAVSLGLGVAFLAAQLLRPERTNPASDPAASFEVVVKPPAPAAAVVKRSCSDCHSNETKWPWYSVVAPASWLVARDVREGRAHMNLSQWNIYGPEMSRLRMKAICEEVTEGNMPPKYYTPLHRDSRLTAADVGALCGLGGS
jgi:hypothetical protein